MWQIKRWGVIVPTAFLCGLLPLCYALVLLNNRNRVLLVVTVAVLSGSVFTAFLLWLRNWRTESRVEEGDCSSSLLVGWLSLGLLLLVPLWASLFLLSVRGGGVVGAIVRQVHFSFHGPIYGHRSLAISYREGLIWIWGILGALLLMAIYRRAQHRRPPLLSLVVWQLGYIALLSNAQFENKSPLQTVVHQERFRQVAERFTSAGDLLHRYVSKMPEFGTGVDHYPPGIPILLRIEMDSGITGLTKILIFSSAVLAIWPIVGIARIFGCDDLTSLNAHVLLVTSTSGLVFPVTAPEPLFMFLSAFSLWLLARILSMNSSYWESVLLGVVIAVFGLFTLTVTFFVLMLASIGILGILFRTCNFKHGASRALLVGVGFFVSTLTLKLVGFELIDCLASAADIGVEQIGVRRVSMSYYLLCSMGNLIAFVVVVGLPLSALF